MQIVSIHEYEPTVKPRVRLCSDGNLLRMKAVCFLFQGSDIVWARSSTFSQAVKNLWERAYHLYGLRWDQEKKRWLEETRDYHAADE